MGQIEVNFYYNLDSDLLSCVFPAARDQVSDQTGIFPFSADDGIPATSLVLYLGYDEESDAVTGELVGLECPYFRKMYPKVRDVVKERIRQAVPSEMGADGLRFDYDHTDLSVIDPDIKQESSVAAFFAVLVSLLDGLYVQTEQFASELVEDQSSYLTPHDRETRRKPIDEPGVRGELVCC